MAIVFSSFPLYIQSERKKNLEIEIRIDSSVWILTIEDTPDDVDISDAMEDGRPAVRYLCAVSI